MKEFKSKGIGGGPWGGRGGGGGGGGGKEVKFYITFEVNNISK